MEPERLAFFTDVPDLATVDWPADTIATVPDEAPGPPTSRIQLFKTGKFRHPVYGRCTITRDTFDQFVANFHTVSQGEIPIDFDHAPEYKGDTRACGWIRALHPEGDELWATVEWTWAGAYAIREREYRYVSPTFYLNFVSDDETKRGPVVVGAGLTNRAFLENMAPVCLSRTGPPEGLEVAVEEPAPDSQPVPDSRPRTMTDFLQQIAAVFSLAEDATETQVLTAAHAAIGNQVPAEHVTVTASRLAELERNTQVPSGHQIVAHGVIEGLQERAQRADRLDAELGELQFEAAFKRAVDEGRATPAQKHNLLQVFKADRKLALDTIAGMLPVVVTAARGDSGFVPATGDTPDGVDVNRDDLDRRARAYMRTHQLGDDKYLDAVNAVIDQQGAVA